MTIFGLKCAIIGLLAVVVTIQLSTGATSWSVAAEDEILSDVAEGEEDVDASVELDEGGEGGPDAYEGGTDAAPSGGSDTEEDEEAERALKPSPDAETNIRFIKPALGDLPAGLPVKVLIGFSNKGSKDFVVDTMDAAFHYPQDYSYYIQNFTAYRYSQTVEPSREATFEYGFTPSETFSSRPFGLTINLNYHDSEGNLFVDAVFNSTISIAEPDDALDGETFFLYVFLAAVVALLVFGAHQLLTSFGKKRLMSSKPRVHVETGTQNNKSDVDYDWLPKETLDSLNKSPKLQKSKTSPRQRVKRSSGTDD